MQLFFIPRTDEISSAREMPIYRTDRWRENNQVAKENDYCTQYSSIRLARGEIGHADLRFADDRDDLQPRQVLLCQSGQVIAQVDRRRIDRARRNQFE